MRGGEVRGAVVRGAGLWPGADAHWRLAGCGWRRGAGSAPSPGLPGWGVGLFADTIGLEAASLGADFWGGFSCGVGAGAVFALCAGAMRAGSAAGGVGVVFLDVFLARR